jgi:hypothetical protein
MSVEGFGTTGLGGHICPSRNPEASRRGASSLVVRLLLLNADRRIDLDHLVQGLRLKSADFVNSAPGLSPP